MLPRFLSMAAFNLALSFLAFHPAAAQLPRMTYELQSGSKIVDECVTCERATLESHLSGTFVLEGLPVVEGELYGVSALDLSSSDPPGGMRYSIQGEGQYYRPNFETQKMGLTLIHTRERSSR